MAKIKAQNLLNSLIERTTDPELQNELREVLLEIESDDLKSSNKKFKAKKFSNVVAKFFIRVAEHEIIEEFFKHFDKF